MPDREVLVGEFRGVMAGTRGASEVLIYTVIPKGSKYPKSIVWWDTDWDAAPGPPSELVDEATYTFDCETKDAGEGKRFWNLKGIRNGDEGDGEEWKPPQQTKAEAEALIANALRKVKVEVPKKKVRVIEDMTTAPANSLMQAVEIVKHGLNVDEVKEVALHLYALLDDLRCEKPTPSEMEQLAAADQDLVRESLGVEYGGTEAVEVDDDEF